MRSASASGSSGGSRSSLWRGLRSALALVWFAFWFFGAFPAALLWWRGASLVPQPGFTLWLGAGIAALASGAVVRKAALFVRQGRGTVVPIEPPTVLVAAGLYRYVRNPMYLLYVAIAVGEAIAYRSGWLLGYAGLLFGIAHLYVVRREEPLLRERFGAAYDDYVARVPRWLPRRSFPLEVRSSAATTRNSRGTL